ncbi:MAG: hypothetical protein GXP10_05935 [Gammaproteobacteria bacterium]|nr:hypothetical protein [Gammaproteobacteria bacterium]
MQSRNKADKKNRTKQWIALLIIFSFCSVFPAAHATQSQFELTIEQWWAKPRDGVTIVEMAAVANAVAAAQRNPDSPIALSYADSEEGLLWSQELRAWLVALGLTSERIEMQANLLRDDIIMLTVQQLSVDEPTVDAVPRIQSTQKASAPQQEEDMKEMNAERGLP